MLSPVQQGILRIGAGLATFGPAFWGAAVGVVLLALILLLRLDEFAAAILVAVGLYLDWYLITNIVAVLTAFALLGVFFLTRSDRYPWVAPRGLWLWVLFVLLAILPARAATDAYEALYYYPHIFLGALIMFWLGSVIARDVTSVRRFFNIIAALGTLFALHTIIVARTGIFLLATSHINTYLASVNSFMLTGSTTSRVGSFLGNPDWNGAFLALLVFVPVGLLAEASSQKAKLIHLVETILILFALLFTYTTASWLALVAGLIPLLVLVGSGFRRVWFPALLVAAVVSIFYLFPNEASLFVQHLASPQDAQTRLGAWQTALRIIQAHPLTGLGLSLVGYLQNSVPFLAGGLSSPLAHPHNSYLELAAMAGLPVLFVFLALLSFALWQALRNWSLADMRTRSLLGGGIAAVITLTLNSVAINAWTLPPIATAGWLMLGVLSSPLLAQSLQREKGQQEHRSAEPPTPQESSGVIDGLASDEVLTTGRK
jgi:O-antigen ligase